LFLRCYDCVGGGDLLHVVDALIAGAVDCGYIYRHTDTPTLPGPRYVWTPLATFMIVVAVRCMGLIEQLVDLLV